MRRATVQAAVLVVVALFAMTALAGVPQLMNYQGRLTNSGGEPLDTTVSIVFVIYDDSTGGNPLWQEIQSVTTEAGAFSLLLGSVISVPDSISAAPDCYLGITVGADPEIVPRTRLVTSPYSFRVSTVDRAGGGSILGDVSIESGAKDAGDLLVSGKATIGATNINDGASAFVAGDENEVDRDYATITGGRYNRASFTGTVVSGGIFNNANDSCAVISGGENNNASNWHSVVAGGYANFAGGRQAVVSGGMENEGQGQCSAVGGGKQNLAGEYAAIGGGESNYAHDYAAVGGGQGNTAVSYSAVGGGEMNEAGDGDHNVIAGGESNIINETDHSAIGGGSGNHVYADHSAIPGGLGNTISASADHSYLFGIGSTLTEDSTFMVDMPHVHIGDEASGYELPVSDGSAGQVLATDGAGQVDWADAQSGVGVVPVGAIVAWVKSFPNTPALPDGFAECNGQTVGDPSSPYNGQSLPELNGSHRFLRGSPVTGNTGGVETHTHPTTAVTPGGVAQVYSGPATHLPPYFEVVWIMRIK